MKVTLKEAVEKLVENPFFWIFLLDVLEDTDNEDTILEEGEVVEIKSGHIVISFTWDMITAVNCITNRCIDLTDYPTLSNIKEFTEIFDKW